jgi:hypothetical protein
VLSSRKTEGEGEVGRGGVQAKPWVTRERKAYGTYPLGVFEAADQSVSALGPCWSHTPETISWPGCRK